MEIKERDYSKALVLSIKYFSRAKNLIKTVYITAIDINMGQIKIPY